MPSARRRSSSTRSRSGIRLARGAAGLRLRLGLAQPADELLGLADRQLLADDRIEDAVLELGRQPAERRPWPSVRRPSATAAWTAGRELEQAQRVGDGRAGAPDAGRDVVLAEPELVDQLAVGVGRLDRVEVLALQVLDERELELVAIDELADDGRDAIEAGRLGRPEAALAGDELVAVDRLGDEDRLEDAVLGDARAERRQVRPGRSACAAGTGSGGSARSGSRRRSACPAPRCGMSAPRPRPRPLRRAPASDGHDDRHVAHEADRGPALARLELDRPSRAGARSASAA